MSGISVTFTTDIPAIAENIVAVLKLGFFEHLKAGVTVKFNGERVCIIEVSTLKKHLPAVSSYIVAVYEDFDTVPPDVIIKGYNQAKIDLRTRK